MSIFLLSLTLCAFRSPSDRTGRPPVVIITSQAGKVIGHDGRHWKG